MFDSIRELARRGKKEKKLTLLKKAEAFRSAHPEKWEARKEEVERRNKLLLGVFEVSPFIQSIHDKRAREAAEARRVMEYRKRKPRRIKVAVQYSTSDVRKSDDSQTVYRAVDDNTGIVDSIKNKIHDDKVNGPTLTLTIEAGSFLLNEMQDIDWKPEKVKVKAHMFPDSEHHGPPLETEYRYVTREGYTRWNHNFVFQGFMPSQYQQRVFAITVVGRGINDKMTLGQVVLSGAHAFINSDTCHRVPTQKETIPVIEALSKPGVKTTYMFSLKPQEIEVKDPPLFDIDLSIGSRFSGLQEIGKRFPKAKKHRKHK